MMRIFFERTGGFAGMRFAATIEVDKLPEADAHTLRNLVDEADFFDLPEKVLKYSVPDEFLYTITVETDKKRHTVHTSDSAATDDLRALLDELSRRARAQRR